VLLPDVNVLIYAHIDGSTPEHDAYARWVTRMATGREPFALSVLVLSGFVRIVTNARVFDPPSTVDEAFAFVSSLTERPNARIVGPGPDHMAIFEHLCRAAGATGSWSRTPSTPQSRWSTDVPWFRLIPILRVSRHSGGSTRLGDGGPVSDGDAAARLRGEAGCRSTRTGGARIESGRSAGDLPS